jgi:hypothetical protein
MLPELLYICAKGNESTKAKKHYDTIKASIFLARVSHHAYGGVFPNMMSNFNIGTRVAFKWGRTSNFST